MNAIYRKQLKGGALYYALFVMMVLSMLCIMLLMFVQITLREDTNFYQSARLNDNVESALEMVCASHLSITDSNDKLLDLFGDGEDTVRVVINRWGLLKTINLHAGWRKQLLQKIVLVGEVDENKWALWMPDMNNYVSLVGKSSITGNCCVSGLGFRKGTVEGKYFQGPFLHKGVMVKSPNKMIEPDEELLKYLKHLASYQPGKSDSLIQYTTNNQNSTTSQPFSQKTIVINKTGNLRLTVGNYSGRIIIRTSDTLFIGTEVKLSQVIVSARVIIINKGFKGNMQAVASKQIQVGSNCVLSYPSYLIVISENPESKITMDTKSTINGGILLFSENAQPGKTIVTIDKDVKFTGKLYLNGQLSLKSNISGSIYCTQFIHYTEREVYYENFLIDNIIDASKLTKDYASFCLKDELFKYQIVERVY